jgi:hypothetical protein
MAETRSTGLVAGALEREQWALEQEQCRAGQGAWAWRRPAMEELRCSGASLGGNMRLARVSTAAAAATQ